MIQSNYTVIILQPTEGNYLTQVTDVTIQERILSKELYLAVNDDPSNWKEISTEEADSIRLQQLALANETLYN